MSAETHTSDSVEQTQTNDDSDTPQAMSRAFVSFLIVFSATAVAFTLWGVKNVIICAKLTYKLCRYTFGKTAEYVKHYYNT